MFIWLIIMVLLVGLDQLSKYLIAGNLVVGDTIPIIKEFFHLTYTRNTGIVFGGFTGAAAEYYWVILILALVATSIFGVLFFRSDFKDKRQFILRLALCLLIAGSLGNAIDRLVQVDHAVIDFIDFKGIWSYIFNLADTYLNVGIFLFFVDIFFLEKKRVKKNG